MIYPHASGYVQIHGKDDTLEWLYNIEISIYNMLSIYTIKLSELTYLGILNQILVKQVV